MAQPGASSHDANKWRHSESQCMRLLFDWAVIGLGSSSPDQRSCALRAVRVDPILPHRCDDATYASTRCTEAAPVDHTAGCGWCNVERGCALFNGATMKFVSILYSWSHIAQGTSPLKPYRARSCKREVRPPSLTDRLTETQPELTGVAGTYLPSGPLSPASPAQPRRAVRSSIRSRVAARQQHLLPPH